MAGVHSITFISVSCLLILLLQIHSGSLAPTHHLKVSVQGNTPTLIVTSSEVGITPKTTKKSTKVQTSLSDATNYATTTSTKVTATAPTPLPKWQQKTNQIKLKSKSQKFLYDKKREKVSEMQKEIEKATVFYDKILQPVTNSAATTAKPTVAEATTRQKSQIKQTSKVTTLAATAATVTVVEVASKERNYGAVTITNAAIKHGTNNERTVTTDKSTISTTSTTYTSASTTASAKNPLETTTNKAAVAAGKHEETEQTVKSSTIAAGTATLGNLPHQTQTKTKTKQTTSSIISSTKTSSTSTKMPTLLLTTMTSTFNADLAFDNDGNVSTISTNTNGNINMKALPRAFSTETSKTEAIEAAMKIASTTIAKDQTPAAMTVITTTEFESLSSSEHKTPPTTTTESAIFSTKANLVTESTSENGEVTTTQAPTANTNNKNSNTNSYTSPAITTEIPIKSMMPPHIDNKEEEDEHTVIKLIDLEKHQQESSISIDDELRTKATIQQNRPMAAVENGGHDGVKQTKKKQLLPKHFIADSIDFEPVLHAAEASSTSKPIPLELDAAVVVATTNEQQNIEKPTLITPTMMLPLHNSYLGPIMMEQLTLSVAKEPNVEAKAALQEHETSIESKLHDGRIVEIIAPTALLENEATTTMAAHPSSMTITKQPNTNTQQQTAPAVLSTTVFQVDQSMATATSTTRQPKPQKPDEQRESKISDIQIEVYDNAVDAVPLPDTKFEIETKNVDLSMETTKNPSVHPTTQERFTQYIVDRTEASTPDTVVESDPKFLGIGKPEPAAIEIHINVSEGITNQSEDLEFSYQQSENTDDLLLPNPLTSKPLFDSTALQSESRSDRGDDILIVEIIDTGDNSTEIQQHHEKPVFTFRTDKDSEIDIKDVKFVGGDDEIFLADAKPPILPPPPPPRGTSTDRDSDTIFYISNTEVKVGESPLNMKPDDTRRAQMRRTRLENQFFPANYIASTHPNNEATELNQNKKRKNKNNHQIQQQQPQMPYKHLYEEDIILSPLRNTADSLKIFRSSQSDGAVAGAPPLDVTYVGESMIEVEQSSGAGIGTTTTASATYATASSVIAAAAATQAPDVIIQPAILPEMSIGVPVIGELPPQIELKEIDFMPNEANQQRSGENNSNNNDIEENFSAGNNDLERLVESSIQYGGDLIDEAADAGGGFDGVEGSYPFGNMAAMRGKATTHKSAADYAHFQFHQSVNNLRKDELSIDVDVEAGTKLTPINDDVGASADAENNTMASFAVAGAAKVVEKTAATAALQSGNGSTSAIVAASSNANLGGGGVGEVVAGERNETKKLSLAEQRRLNSERVAFTDLITTIVAISLFIFVIIISIFGVCISKDVYAKWHDGPPCSSENIPNGDMTVCQSGENGSVKEESTNRLNSSAINLDSLELVVKVNANEEEIAAATAAGSSACLPSLLDANSTVKPSNNTQDNNKNSIYSNNCSKNYNNKNNQNSIHSNSLNIVNEMKQNADNLVVNRKNRKSEEESNSKTKDNHCPATQKTTTLTNSISLPSINNNNNNNNKYAGPNGSITKMTLKNNHLIVETEERNDISRNARETKMHYNASEKDGVFVVEVARGIDSNMVPESPAAVDLAENNLNAFQAKANGNVNSKSPTRKYEDEPAVLNSHEQVQIHQPPTELQSSSTERSLHQIDEVEEESILSPKPLNKNKETNDAGVDFTKNANTGLSQSDLSSTSSNDSNKRYTYGHQELYTIEQTDYAVKSPNGKNITSTTLKNVNESKDDDRTSENGKGFEHTPEKTNNNNENNNNDEALNEVNKVEKEITNNDDKKESEVELEVDTSAMVPQQEEQQQPAPKMEAVVKVASLATSTPQPMDTSIESTAAQHINVIGNELEQEQHNEDNDDDDENEFDVCKVQENISSRSVSEVELNVMESLTSETDTTQKLNIEKVENSTSNGFDGGDLPPLPPSSTSKSQIAVEQQQTTDNETDPENAYDSLMSLPDPPSNDEMTQFSDFHGIEISSQLDSLPPPPPLDENINMPDIVAEINSSNVKSKTAPVSVPVVLNGNVEYDCNGHGNLNGHHHHEQSQQQQVTDHSTLPQLQPLPTSTSSSLLEEVNSNGKIVPNSPLTPPESPPSSPPIPYSNGVLGINEHNCAKVAVDVNVS